MYKKKVSDCHVGTCTSYVLFFCPVLKLIEEAVDSTLHTLAMVMNYRTRPTLSNSKKRHWAMEELGAVTLLLSAAGLCQRNAHSCRQRGFVKGMHTRGRGSMFQLCSTVLQPCCSIFFHSVQPLFQANARRIQRLPLIQ